VSYMATMVGIVDLDQSIIHDAFWTIFIFQNVLGMPMMGQLWEMSLFLQVSPESFYTQATNPEIVQDCDGRDRGEA
jgi:hypothetical protein